MEIGSIEWNNILFTGAETLGVHLEAKQLNRFALHADELIKWNRKINITAITDPAAIAVKHFLDSIAPANFIPRDAVMLDIGSGGGFPGIPLKVVSPSLSVRLVDSSHKRVSFMKQVIRKLDLADIDAIHERAENLSENNAYSHSFDVIVSRALSDLSAFLSMALPLLKSDGIIVAFKGPPDEGEIDAVKRLTHKMMHNQKRFHGPLNLVTKTYTLPYLNLERSIFIFKAAE